MGIVLPEYAGQRFLLRLRELRDKLSAVETQTGDLTFAIINDIEELHNNVQTSFVDLATEASANAPAALAYLQGRGITLSNVSAVAAAVNNLKTANDDWAAFVLTSARSLSGSDLVIVRQFTRQGVTFGAIGLRDNIPAATAQGLRLSAELAAYIASVDSFTA